MPETQDLIKSYAEALVGLPVSHIWNGHGTALFVEFGQITPTFRRDGSPGNGDGEFGLMIEWAWRIEDASVILCGSDNEKAEWPPIFERIIGQRVTAIDFVGRLPEVTLSVSGGFYLTSFMTTAGQPEWTIFDRRSRPVRWLHVEKAEIIESSSLR